MNCIKEKIFFLLFLVFSSTSVLLSQVVYEPLHRDVYNFLRRLSQKGIIEFNDLVRPLPRIYIAEKLFEADSLSSKLTSLEKDELVFFIRDFYHEQWFLEESTEHKNHLDFVSNDPAQRWRFFSYGSDAFKMNAGIILGAEIGSLDKSKLTHFWNGVYTYGYISDVLGFSFDFRDNTEKGNTIDKQKKFSPVTGINEKSDRLNADYPGDKIEYSEAKGVLATNWQWGSAAVGKEFLEWGYADNGLIVLSQKAPSFPFIRLDINPVEWLHFNYFHAWLSSDVVDSSLIYYTEEGNQRFQFREKYIASHSLTITPTRGLDISIGESIVYADKPEVLYLIPITFFRIADHYLSRQYNAAGGNAQLFASLSSKGHLKNTHLYGTLFIDEVTLSSLFDSNKQRNQLGFTLGSSLTDLLVNNLTFKLEYSKIYPYVYKHYIPTTTYESASYVLGHWMGNNADQVFASVQYRFLRGLEAIAWLRYIRQGEAGSIDGQYTQPQPPFLFGLRTNYTYLGTQLKYEILHELFVRARYQFMKTSVEQEDLSFIDKNIHEFHFAVFYGL
jgi:hypothetical protein